jgi:DNA-binding winged helix-turn-helix (wHTH) protein/tetratricopeptide (TPR) repeat protein
MSGGPVSVFEFGPFRVDAVERTLVDGGSKVVLTDKVFDLLLLLLENQGRALGKAELMRSLWPDTVVEENNLTVNISVLRKALGERVGERRYIETLSRRGYRFIAEVRAPSELEPPPSAVQPSSANGSAGPGSVTVHARALVPPTFVGRQRELALLGERLDAARAGQGRLVFVTGDPGLGKTELCEQFLERVRQERQPSFITHGRCLEQVGVGEAYLPFLEALRALALGPSGAAALPVLRQQAPTWCAELGLAAELHESRPGRSLVRASSTARMLREMGDALEALSAIAPVVLLLEDVHWADPSSCDLLRLLGQRLGHWPALVLATCRDAEVERDNHPLRNVRRELSAHDQCEELGLPLLDRVAIVCYLDARFEPHGLPSELAELIFRTTEGHPLFVTRLVQLLLDRGDIRQADGRHELARPVTELELGVPQGVRGLIQKKLESLDAEAERALSYASVIGVEFNSALLAGLLQLDEVEVDERLDQLTRAHRLLAPLGEERLPSGRLTLRYRFAHVLYRNVLYDGLAGKRRMLLHESIAQALLAEYGKEAWRVAAPLALHFEAARDFERAIEHLIAAADNVGRVLANREAKQYYARALELLPELPAAEQVPLGIILCYNHIWVAFKVGDYERAIADAETMLRLARDEAFAGEGEEPERARRRVFDYFSEPWRDAYGMKDMPRMPNQDFSMGAAAIVCEASDILSYLLFHTGRLEEMGARATELFDLALATGNEPRRVEALGWLATHAFELGRLDAASVYLAQGLPAARELGYERAMILLCNTMGRIHQQRGEYEQAEALQVEALSYTFEVSGRVDFLTQTGLARLHLGRLAEALGALREARDVARRSELGPELQLISNFFGWVYIEAGDTDRAIAELEEGATMAEAAGLVGARVLSLLLLVRALIEHGAVGQARVALEQAQALGAGASAPPPRAGSRAARRRLGYDLVHGRLLLAEQRPAEASRAAAAALELAAKLAAPKYLAQARLLSAEVSLALGDAGGAAQLARQGLAGLLALPVPIVAWKLGVVFGAAATKLGDATGAASAFTEAAALCERIEAGLGESVRARLFRGSPGRVESSL